MFKKILVPVDGAHTCDKAVSYVKEIATRFNSEVILFNAQDVTPSIAWVNDPVVFNQLQYDPDQLANEILNHAKEAYKEVTFPVTTYHSIGDPAHAILDAADELDVEMIIMCTHGMKAVKRFLLGSVTDKVVHHASVAVLVVR